MLNSVYGICRKALLENKMIFGNTLFQQGAVKRLVTYQLSHQIKCNILNYLTMLNILSIIMLYFGEGCIYMHLVVWSAAQPLIA